ncbi:MAG: CRISPR-associated endoribonuclease Cas6 [Peptostreptococcaceae bacterium]|nr:CRISPR-associated endoribonuclease Cas6 [Peptostreptococcaceae bacterium]
MKYVVKMQLAKPEFKSDFRRTNISFFKKSISNYQDGMFYEEIYNSGVSKKSLVWSIGFGKVKFCNDIIELDNCSFEITMKNTDAETALIYYSSLLGMRGEAFPLSNDNYMELKSIKMVCEETINNEIALFKIRSPLCLKKHTDRTNNDRYVNIEDKDFAIELEKKLIEDLPYLEEKIKELRFNFDGLKKTITTIHKTSSKKVKKLKGEEQ